MKLMFDNINSIKLIYNSVNSIELISNDIDFTKLMYNNINSIDNVNFVKCTKLMLNVKHQISIYVIGLNQYLINLNKILIRLFIIENNILINHDLTVIQS